MIGATVRPNTCASCRRSVIWATMAGKPVPVEKCGMGRGDIALTRDMLDPNRAPTATRVSNGTGYRLHYPNCAGLQPHSKPFRRAAVR